IFSYKLASRRSLYNATALKAELTGLQHGSHYDFCHNLEAAKRKSQIVVIGAGIAGLSAAQHLLANGFQSTIVLEATERYGGRISSKRFGDTYCELGAKWINIDGSHDSMYELLTKAEGLTKQLKQPMCVSYVQPGEERQVPAGMVQLIDTLFRQLCRGFRVRDRIKSGTDLQSLDNVMSYLQAESVKLIQCSFQQPDEQQLAREIFQSLFKEFSSILGCCLEYVNIQHLTSCPLQHELNPIYVPTGLDNVVSALAQDLDPLQLHTGKPVGQIQWKTHETQLSEPQHVGCLDGSLYQADHIICTLPLGVLKNFATVLFKPTLPLQKLQAISNLGFGNPVKIYLSYKRPIGKWIKSNLRPLGALPGQAAQADRNWTQQIVEISQLPKSQHVLEVRVGGGYYDEIEKLPDISLLEQFTQLMRQCLGNPQVPYPQSVLRSNWSSSACYLGGRPYFSTQSSARDVQSLGAPLGDSVPTLLFAGDATALQGFGTIDGARYSGIREAQRIIDYYHK
ncbi:CG10561, partial [Drosophila busckii]